MNTNINGFRNNFTELKYVVNVRKPDIILLNETHLTDKCDVSDLRIKNYNIINALSYSKHTGGVTALINKKIKERVSCLAHNTKATESCESKITK